MVQYLLIGYIHMYTYKYLPPVTTSVVHGELLHMVNVHVQFENVMYINK